jgi:hypothetical protein
MTSIQETISRGNLNAVMGVWGSSSLSYETRVSQLENTRLIVDEELQPFSVLDDNAIDTLTGDNGRDWFFFNVDAEFVDVVTDLRSNEFATDIDFITLDMVS